MISMKRQQQRAAHTDLWSCRGCQTLQLVSEGLVISWIGIAGPESTGAKSRLVRASLHPKLQRVVVVKPGG
jgi:hypothetical protein